MRTVNEHLKNVFESGEVRPEAAIRNFRITQSWNASLARLALAGLFALAPLPLVAATESLCSADEETIFSCKTKRKTFEICASRDLSATTGYMQYRAGSNGKVQFVYPSQRVLPAGKFRFSLLAQGAQLSFQNGEFKYEITEPLIGRAEIWVSQGSGGAVQAAECRNFSESLTLTTTQNRFKDLGIYE